MKKVAGIFVDPLEVAAVDLGFVEGNDGQDYAHPVLILKSGERIICPTNEYLEAAEKMLEGVVRELLVVN